MGEKFPEEKGVLVPEEKKWENQLNRPSCSNHSPCRNNTEGPVSGLHGILEITIRLIFDINQHFADATRPDTRGLDPATQEARDCPIHCPRHTPVGGNVTLLTHFPDL